MEVAGIAESASRLPPAADFGTTADGAADRVTSRLRLLIIDDDIQQDDALLRMLAFDGIDATTVQSGTVGVACAATGGFDAILLDLHLPDILGMTVLSVIRAKRIPVPVIVFTGHFLDTDHEEKALQVGAAAFLTKPIFEATPLAAMIRRVVATYVPPSDAPAGSTVPAPRARRGPSSARRRREIPGLVGLHARVLGGDAGAIEEIVALLLPELSGRLRRALPRAGVDWIDPAVEDALLDYRSNPGRYDPARGRSLDGYLLYNAKRKLLNRLDSTRRRLTHETEVPHEFWRVLAASSPEAPSAALDRLRAMLATVRSSLTPEERIVHDLQMAEEHDTTVYARALHLEHLPWRAQVRRVRLRTDAVSHTVRRALLRLRDQLFPPAKG